MTPELLAQRESNSRRYLQLETPVRRIEVLAGALEHITFDVFYSETNVAKDPAGNTILSEKEVLIISGLSQLLCQHVEEAMKLYRDKPA